MAKVNNAARLRAARARQYKMVRQWKLSAGMCAICGLVIDDRTVLCIDCDHVTPSQKTFTIASNIGKVSDRRLQSELSKCQAICRNCHALRTHDEQHRLGSQALTMAQTTLWTFSDGTNQ